jgi:hypothetical protein
MPTEVKGALALRKALRQFEPDLARETTKEIGNFLKPIVKQAKGFMPSNDAVPSGWLKREKAKGRWAPRYYDQGEAKRGIGYKTSPSKPDRRGFKSLASVSSKNIGGVIYEWAGRTSGIEGNFTPKLPNANGLEGRNKGMRGRALFKAYNQDEGKARKNIINAIEAASKKLNARSKV